MATKEELSISITAELGDLRAQLKEVGNLGDAEIRDMIKGIQKSLKTAEKAAEKAAGSQKAIGAAAKNSAEAAKKAATMLGGSFAQAGEAIFELAPKIASVTAALGPIGMGGVAAAAAIGAIGASALLAVSHLASLADAGLEARAALSKLWEAAGEDEQLRKLEEFRAPLAELAAYETAIRALDAAHQEAALVAGAAQTNLAIGWKAFGQSARDAIANGLSVVAEDFARNVAPTFVLGLERMGEGLKDASADADKLTSSLWDMRAAADDAEMARLKARSALLAPVGETPEAKREREAKEREAAQRAKERAAELAKEIAHQKTLSDARYKALAASFNREYSLKEAEWAKEAAGEDKFRKEELARVAAIEARKTEAIKAEVDAQLRAYAELDAKRQETLRVQGEIASQFAIEAAGAYRSLVDASTDYTIEAYEARERAGERFTQAETEAYEAAIRKRKAAAVVEVLVNAAVAYAGLVAQMAPTTGPGAFLIAAGLVGAGLIAPLSAILGESIPFGVSGAGGTSDASGTPYSESNIPKGANSNGAQDKYDLHPRTPEWLEKILFPGEEVNDLWPDEEADRWGSWNPASRGSEEPAPSTAPSTASAARSSRSSGTSAGVMVTLDRRTSMLRVVQDVPGKTSRGKV